LGEWRAAGVGAGQRGRHRRQGQPAQPEGGCASLALGQRLRHRSGLGVGQEAGAEKSNERTAIPVLLESLLLKGVIVTIDAMGTPRNIAPTIRAQEADDVLAVKDHHPQLAESIATFFDIGQTEGWKNTPYRDVESVEKDHGRLEVRRCWAFGPLDCLANRSNSPTSRGSA
jgi:predicted transposase YbfD/YdcC